MRYIHQPSERHDIVIIRDNYEALSAKDKRAVASGAALLDDKRPGWADEIDLDSLQLSSSKQCVLGQLFPNAIMAPFWVSVGYNSLAQALEPYDPSDERYESQLAHYTESRCTANYDAGKYILGLSDIQTIENGFCRDVNYESTWGALDIAWAKEVTDRQEGNSA